MASSPQQLGERLWKPWFLVAIALVGCYQLVNGDIWWHLRTGELIWQRGTHAPGYPRPGIREDEIFWIMTGTSWQITDELKLGLSVTTPFA